MPRIEPFEEHAAKYEDWFEKNHFAYLSELQAVKEQLPEGGEGVEIGVGTGRFAAPLGVRYGVEPSLRMGRMARRRAIRVVAAYGEALPLADGRFDTALMVTTLCFLDDVPATFSEVYRILIGGGLFVIGFVDKESHIGNLYQRHKEDSTFYRIATFYSPGEVIPLLTQAGFRDINAVQTLFHGLRETNSIEPVKPGFGEGSFVVIRGRKRRGWAPHQWRHLNRYPKLPNSNEMADRLHRLPCSRTVTTQRAADSRLPARRHQCILTGRSRLGAWGDRLA